MDKIVLSTPKLPIKKVAVPAISFCQHDGLVKLIREKYPDCKLNLEEHPYYRSEEETIEYLKGYVAARKTDMERQNLREVGKTGQTEIKEDMKFVYSTNKISSLLCD